MRLLRPTRVLLLLVLACAALPAAAAPRSITASYEGTVEVRITEDVDLRYAETDYFLRLNEHRRIPLRFEEPPARLESGMRIQVSGQRDADGTLVVPHGGLRVVAAPDHVWAEVVQGAPTPSVAIVRIQFPGDSRTLEDNLMKNAVLNGSGGYYGEVSYQSTTGFSQVDELASVVIQSSSSPCAMETWGNEAKAIVETDHPGLLSTYNYVIYAWPSAPGCTFGPGLTIGGVAEVNGRRMWINGDTGSITHEFGHNFGVRHGGGCKGFRFSLDGNPGDLACDEFLEYVDPFDVMGRRRAHMSAFHKGVIGWPVVVQEVPATVGRTTWELDPIEGPSAGRPHALRIPFSQGHYFVEYRRPQGVDASVLSSSGLVIRFTGNLGCNLGGGGCDNILVDTTPGSVGPSGSDPIDSALPDFQDAPLTVGRIFSDVRNQIHVEPLSLGNTARVRVTVGMDPTGCRRAPTFEIQPLNQKRKRTFEIKVINNDLPLEECAAGLDFRVSFESAGGGTWKSKPRRYTTGLLPPGGGSASLHMRDVRVWPIEFTVGGAFGEHLVSLDAAGNPNGVYDKQIEGYYDFNSLGESDPVNPAHETPYPSILINGSEEASVTIPYNSSATVSWSGLFAAGCNLTYNQGLPAGSGTAGTLNTGPLTVNRSYSLSCWNGDRIADDSMLIKVQGTTCSPECNTRTCGQANGCGVPCEPGSGCSTCTRRCINQYCGLSDGCGGLCEEGSGCMVCVPHCGPDKACNLGDGCFGACFPYTGCCQTQCAGKACGSPDGCGGTCQPGSGCSCTPQCAGKTCGAANGCGGTCKPGSGCNCTPSCNNKSCGSSNGCGGICQPGSGCFCVPYCGDKVCGQSNGCTGTCQIGSGCTYCGDGVCNGPETKTSCAVDCVVCGDGVCDYGYETRDSCFTDCW